ncbi:hypothetical protein, partial [Flavobacterium chungbukense]
MIDHMNANSDPREAWLFEKGQTATVFTGLDPTLTSGVQQQLLVDGKIAVYNRSVISRNKWLPGTLIN